MTRLRDMAPYMSGGKPISGPKSVLGMLAAHAAKLGIDPAPVRAMHRLVDFYDPPAGYVRRLKTLKNIAELRLGHDLFADWSPQLALWQPYITALLENTTGFADSAGLLDEERRLFFADDDQDPLRGVAMNTHQLEALLWMEVKDQGKEEDARFLLVQGQMVSAQASILEVAYTEAVKAGVQMPALEVFRALGEPNLFARRFSDGNWVEFLRQFPLIADAAEYAKALEDLRKGSNGKDRKIPKKVDESLAGIISHIWRGCAKNAYEKRAFNGRRYEHRSESESGSEFTISKGSAATKAALQKSGECPEDHLRTRTFIMAQSEVAVSHLLAAKARENQMLPRRYREPSPREYASLIQQMRANADRFTGLFTAQELIAWIETVFHYGCSPEQATDLLVGFPDTHLTDCDFMLRMGQTQESDQMFPPRMRVRALEPEYDTVYARIAGERERVAFFPIPDLGGVANSIRDLLRELQGTDRSELSPDSIRGCAVKIFRHEADTYVKAVNDFAASIGLGDRVTVSGLGKVLFQRYVEAGDVVSAALLTCNRHKLASVRLWYFSPRVDFLRRVQRLGLESVIAELPEGSGVFSSQTALVSSNEYVGSRRCAEFRFIQGRVDVLQRIVEQPVAVRSIADRRRAFVSKHNSLTVLAIWAIDLSVGMRSSTHPYFHVSEYDRATGMGSLWDKGIKKARSFRLSELAMQIAEVHDSYLAQLKPYGLPSSTKAQPCYFVDEDLNITPATPESIEKYLGNFFLFAPNWARRMVRTIALEEGVPATYLDAYCGHSNYGQEPHYTFSSFDPLPYFECMTGFLSQLLQDLGFKPLRFDPGFLKVRP